MRIAYAIAALLALAAATIRTWDGEVEILRAARTGVVDQQLLGFFHLTWYMVTVVFVLAGGALAYLAIDRRAGAEFVGLIIGVIFLAWSGVVAIVSSLFVWHSGTVVAAVVTLLIGGFAIAGSRAGVKRNRELEADRAK